MAEKPQITLATFKKDAYIIFEGPQPANRFFIIREGQVRCINETGVVKKEGDILVPGDFFGVIATISAHSHIETAQALTDVVLISVQRNQFEGLVQYNTPIAMKIILYFSQHMRYLNETLAKLSLKQIPKEEGEDGLVLFNTGEFYDNHRSYTQAYYAYHQYNTYYPQGSYVQKAKDRMEEITSYIKPDAFAFNQTEVTRTYTKDTILFAEGEPGDELFILQSGSVKITRITNGNEVLLAVLKPTNIFGEMALLESKPRSANAIAYEDCTVMTVNLKNFQHMAQTNPQIITRLTKLLAERLWVSYKQVANTCIADPVGRMYDALLTNLEKNRVPMQPNSSYTFDFGPKELAAMVGISPEKTSAVLQRLLNESTFIKVVDNKMYTSNVVDIVKQNTLYKRLHRRNQSINAHN
ncbi:MAG: cyclic nucleotide-binding domain-containing protein [Treponema sp.]|jgi:CRP-like cAMP-binding protein|nr:cyclic nucleotide-binding domain-containing protein [Treponema sp.]